MPSGYEVLVSNTFFNAKMLVCMLKKCVNLTKAQCPEMKLALIGMSRSEPTDRRSSRTGPKKILEDWSFQDLKIAKRTSKGLQEL